MIRKSLLVLSVVILIFCTGCANTIKKYYEVSTPLEGDRPVEIVPEEWTPQVLANRVLPGGLEIELLDEDMCVLSKADEGDIIIYKYTKDFEQELATAKGMYPAEETEKSILEDYKLLKVKFNERYTDYYLYKENGYIFRIEIYSEENFDKFMLYIKELIS